MNPTRANCQDDAQNSDANKRYDLRCCDGSTKRRPDTKLTLLVVDSVSDRLHEAADVPISFVCLGIIKVIGNICIASTALLVHLVAHVVVGIEVRSRAAALAWNALAAVEAFEGVGFKNDIFIGQ